MASLGHRQCRDLEQTSRRTWPPSQCAYRKRPPWPLRDQGEAG
ncbi:mCG1036161 [Mus musculus]|nr:mCG1036161 [Mus musculus]